MITARRSVIPDIPPIAVDMRPADRDEVMAAVGMNPHQALLQGYLSSTECFTIYEIDGGLPVGMFGYTEVEPKLSACVWMLGSNRLLKNRWTFLKRSREWVDYIHARYPMMYNVIDRRNTLHIRWIEWLGFKFVRIIPNYGTQKLEFVEFVKV